jgi:hypothetical protein
VNEEHVPEIILTGFIELHDESTSKEEYVTIHEYDESIGKEEDVRNRENDEFADEEEDDSATGKFEL